MVFVSSLLCSHFYEKRLKKKAECLEELILFINFIKNKIEYFSTPIEKIFLEFSTKNEFIVGLIQNKSADLSLFDNETRNQIISFINNVGNGFKKEQIAFCEYNIALFSQLLTKIKSESPNKIKIFRAISLFVGISAIILLI